MSTTSIYYRGKKMEKKHKCRKCGKTDACLSSMLCNDCFSNASFKEKWQLNDKEAFQLWILQNINLLQKKEGIAFNDYSEIPERIKNQFAKFYREIAQNLMAIPQRS